MPGFTREQVNSISVGYTHLRWGIDRPHGDPKVVTNIHAKREDIHGKLFVCGYIEFGPTSQISFSIKEGDEGDFKRYEIINPVCTICQVNPVDAANGFDTCQTCLDKR